MDYSRFDNIDCLGSDDEEEADSTNEAGEGEEAAIAIPQKVDPNVLKMHNARRTNKTKEGRIAFEYEGRTIYEWEQSLEEINIYIAPPQGLPKDLIDIRITYNHLVVGVKDANPFIGMYIRTYVRSYTFVHSISYFVLLTQIRTNR